MILVDSGALYALADRDDTHHQRARSFFHQAKRQEMLAVPIPVVVEAALLLEARLGMRAIRALWDDLLAGVFELLPVGPDTLLRARAIDRKHADAHLGIVDCTCLALCEHHRISTVFTFDRRHFAMYRPGFVRALRLVP